LALLPWRLLNQRVMCGAPTPPLANTGWQPPMEDTARHPRRPHQPAHSLRTPLDKNCNWVQSHVGKSFACDLKEQLARSAVFRYGSDAGFQLNVVSVSGNPDQSNDDNSSTVSIVLIMEPPSTTGKKEQPFNWFLGQWALNVGKERTNEMAKQLLAQVADNVDKLRKAIVSAPTVGHAPATEVVQ